MGYAVISEAKNFFLFLKFVPANLISHFKLPHLGKLERTEIDFFFSFLEGYQKELGKSHLNVVVDLSVRSTCVLIDIMQHLVSCK